MKIKKISALLIVIAIILSVPSFWAEVVSADTESVSLKDGSALTLAEKDGVKYVYDVPENLKSSDFIKNFKGAVKYVDADGIDVSDDRYVTTGGMVSFVFSDDFAYAVISSDVNGSGNVDVTDYLQIKRHILKVFVLSGAKLEAADIDHDGNVDTTDLIFVKKHFLMNSVIGASFTNDNLVEEVINISEIGDSAVIKTEEATYKASGYESVGGDKFVIKSGFTAQVHGINEQFNRMTFKYTATEPVKLTVGYDTGDDDSFFIEAAENSTFNCLISTYLSGKTKNKIVSVSAETCNGKEAGFMIYGISVEKAELINKQVFYLENSRFKVGIKLAWGGGITYISDKTSSANGFTNLVNNHDTGRMIQQSYYGTAGNDEYTPGTYSGNRWTYNPVQGGDQYGSSSRLIDVSVTETSVYVKSQPKDWSKNNYLTPSYMENVYTVTGDYIRVDNRFVDFSGWEHRYSHQELPALYTVSGLSRFTWYDGVNSWQDDELTHKDDLKFWGDPKYSNDCYFKMREGNTETWCAWSSPADDFGLGIYVPEIDILLAGRYAYNGSKISTVSATNYVAPLNTMKINSFIPIEYSYLITTGSVDHIRKVFKANKDFADNSSLHYDYIPSRIEQ